MRNWYYAVSVVAQIIKNHYTTLHAVLLDNKYAVLGESQANNLPKVDGGLFLWFDCGFFFYLCGQSVVEPDPDKWRR